MQRYELGTTIRLSVVFTDIDNVLVNPTSVTVNIHRPDGVVTAVDAGDINNPAVGYFNALYTTVIEGEHAYTFTGTIDAINFSDVKSGFFYVIEYLATDVDPIVPILRFYLGDYTPPYRYTTNTLREALIFSIKMLMRKWNSRYSVTTDGVVTRNPLWSFPVAAPPTIQVEDEPPIVIQAAIIIKSGSLQEASWQTASWRDDEIQVSNIQGQRSREKSLDKDLELLDSYFKSKLHAGIRQSLGGFHYPLNWREG